MTEKIDKWYVDLIKKDEDEWIMDAAITPIFIRCDTCSKVTLLSIVVKRDALINCSYCNAEIKLER